MNTSHHKKIIIIVLVGVFFLVFGGLLLRTPFAEANVFGDIWNRLFTPFSSTHTTPSANPKTTDSVPLYKPALDYEKTVIEAVKKTSPAVVSVIISKNVPIIERCPISPFYDLSPEFRNFFGDDVPQLYGQCERGSELREVGGGSGFIVSSNGLIVTNKHVVSDKNASYTVFTNDGKKYNANVLARDPSQDIAILKVEAVTLPTLEFGNSDSLELGQSVIAIGNALGEFRNTVSVGVISGLSRTVTASGGSTTETIKGVIQTDAAINPGNSGGPLLNLKGEVIGINTAVASNAQNIGFAIPINRVKKAIESVKRSGKIQTPFLGIRYFLITPEIAKEEKLPVEYGALVRGTNKESGVVATAPAAKAGILAEDIIIAVQGKRVDRENDLSTLISQFNVGDTISLTIRRGGKEIVLSVTLENRSDS